MVSKGVLAAYCRSVVKMLNYVGAAGARNRYDRSVNDIKVTYDVS